MSLSGNRALIGASWADRGEGSAYIFERNGAGGWEEAARIKRAVGDRYLGYSVSLAEGRALVGVAGTATNYGTAAYVFEPDELGNWEKRVKLHKSGNSSVPGYGGGYPQHVSLSSEHALLGGATQSFQGEVLVFDATAIGEVSIHTSCLAGNGRLTVNLLNGSTASSVHTLQFEGLATRERTVAFEDWGRISITGRPAGEYAVSVFKDGNQINSTSVVFNCNETVPDVSEPEVSVINACRNGLGQVFFQMVNPTPDTKGYVIEFEGVRNRSTSATAYGQARRGTTGRPNGSYDYLVRSGTTNISHGNVVVDCN